MTQLQLRLDQPGIPEPLREGAVARVRWLADADGNPVKDWWQEQRTVDLLPTGGAESEFTSFDLPGGGYFEIDLSIPRGENVLREVHVEQGETARETITMAISPHEYLGWQQFAGSISAERELPVFAEDFAPGSRAEALQQAARKRVDLLDADERPIPRLTASYVPPSADAWVLIDHAARARNPQAVVAADNQAVDWPSNIDEAFVAWFPPTPDYGDALNLSSSLREPTLSLNPLETRFPRWLVVSADGQMDLVSLPWVWWVERSSPNENVRLIYDRRAASAIDHQRTGRTVVGVQDSRWFALLEFLSSGRLFQASPIADAVVGTHADWDQEGGPEFALYQKLKGPLVAVAGALVLLARTKTAEPQYWDRWLVNLADWFPGIPDGPILLAYRTLQTAQTRDALDAAFGYLQEGFARGIPFMSATIRIMALALAQLGSDIEAADDLRRRIGPVAARVDPDQPFTVMRLGSRQ